jgi:cyclophilin family peptidyl-prolyl cis-trans isomerase
VLVIALGVYTLYANHIGPFALAKTPPKKSAASINATATANAVTTQKAALQSAIAASPCNNAAIIKEITNTSAAPSAAASAKITRTYSEAPKLSIDTKKVYCVGMNTNRGLIVVELNPAWAPETVNNFVYLAQHHFYDGLTFHRVISNGSGGGPYIIQGGDPKGDGTGGPGYQFKDEPVPASVSYYAGTIAMANSGPNTNGSQFCFKQECQTGCHGPCGCGCGTLAFVWKPTGVAVVPYGLLRIEENRR